VSPPPPSAEGAVVVPLDGSANAENAVAMAILVARSLGRRIHFVHVIPADASRPEEDREGLAARFAEYANDLAKHYRLAREHFSAYILEGPAAQEIVTHAAKAYLLVLASHGRGGFKAAIIGSVADRIVRGTPCPVLLVRGVQRPRRNVALKRILVCLDGSTESERGLAAGRELAAATGAGLSALRAFSVPHQVDYLDFLYYDPEELGPGVKAEAEAYLERVLGPGETPIVVEGPTADVIAETAKQTRVDLIVIATRGLGAARRLLLGSTTDKVIRMVEAPVLIIPPPPAEPAEAG
jgi:nucleotide-binding universal stress UspA family protein